MTTSAYTPKSTTSADVTAGRKAPQIIYRIMARSNDHTEPTSRSSISSSPTPNTDLGAKLSEWEHFYNLSWVQASSPRQTGQEDASDAAAVQTASNLMSR